MKRNQLLLWINALIISCSLVPKVLGVSDFGSESTPVTQRTLNSVHIDADGITNALAAFARDHQVVIGVEDSSFVTSVKIRLDLSSTTVGEVLNALIAYAPGYAWRLDSDGAIHIYYPSQDRDKLANVKIRSFRVSDYTLVQVWDAVGKIPEFQDWLRQNNCSQNQLMTGHEFRNDSKRIWFDGSGKTVGQALDEAASQSGVYSWSIFQYQLNGECMVGIRLW